MKILNILFVKLLALNTLSNRTRLCFFFHIDANLVICLHRRHMIVDEYVDSYVMLTSNFVNDPKLKKDNKMSMAIVGCSVLPFMEGMVIFSFNA